MTHPHVRLIKKLGPYIAPILMNLGRSRTGTSLFLHCVLAATCLV